MRRKNSKNQRKLASLRGGFHRVLLASVIAGTAGIGFGYGEDESGNAKLTPLSDAAEAELELNAPANLGIEPRVAERPLLERLVGPATERPRRVVPESSRRQADPPSLDAIGVPPPQNDGWNARDTATASPAPRQASPTPQAAKSQAAKPQIQPTEKSPLTNKSIPLTDPPYLRSNSAAAVQAPAKAPVSTKKSATIEKPGTTEKSTDLAKPSRSVPQDRSSIQSIEPKPEATVSKSPARALIQSGDANANESDLVVEQSKTKFDYAGYPLKPLSPTRSSYQMRTAMRNTLRSYYSEFEVANGRSNWGMMHAIMVYGVDTKVIVGRKTYSTIAWIAGNNICRGQRLIESQNGQIKIKSGVGLQGHEGQMMMVFAMAGVPEDYPIYAGRERYSMRDVIEAEKAACKSGEELTFILIGLSHYLDTDETWVTPDGEQWSFERLIREELSQPIVGAACGGAHRLMGFAHALRKRRMEGKSIEGQWKRAETFVEDFIAYTYRLQNRDGSMSTDWFEGREDNGDLDRKIQTTGHMVEWLLTALPDSELQNPRLVAAVRFLLKSMAEERKHDWSIGPKGHALRSLKMFYERVYRTELPWQPSQVATTGTTTQRHR